MRGVPSGGLGALATTTGLPSLREVRFCVYDRGYTSKDFLWLLGAPCGHQLQRLVVPGDEEARAGWQEVLEQHAPLQEIVLTSRGVSVSLTKLPATAR